MAIGRLLSPKLTAHFNSRGSLPLPRRWFSSSLEDGRKYERLPVSEASPNKDIGQKRMHWYSLGGLLTNLKQKIIGNMFLIDKTSGEDSVSPKSPVVSSSDVTATKVVSSLNVSENKNCISSSIKEESSVSKMGTQDASTSVAGIETSVNEERLDNIKRLDGLEFAQEKVLKGKLAKRVDSPKEPSSKDVSIGFLTEEVSESLASSGENEGKLQPEKGQSDQTKPPQNSLSKFFINSDPDKEVKLPLRFEALSNSNSSMSTGESCSDVGDLHGLFGKILSDPVPKMKSISKENDEHRLSDAPQNPYSLTSILLRGASHDQKSGDLAAIRERKSTFSFESSTKTVVPVVPVAVSRDLSMKKVMDFLNLPIDTGTDADANSWNPNGGEGKCVFIGNSVTKMSDSFCATEERESKWETLDLQNKPLCNQATLATTTTNSKVTKKSLFALSVGEHSPNKVLLRFLKETCEKKDIVDALSKFGAVLDVQEIPSFEGCIYKDALVTFETNSAMKMALKKAVVPLKNHTVVVEETSQEDMVEQICIPDLIGDPDVPIALVKEPTRTVKIHLLEHDISSNQIKEALKFCRSNISKIILGSSKTAAFVEFETEDGKERALAEHIISILNKQLFISRIDIPRTTVARISNLSELSQRDLWKLCKPYGQIKRMLNKGKGITDVHFEVSEWPNMLTILNSLNGKKIDGMKWVVRPATVIPPEILKALWEDPQEKRYVESVIQNLVREIEKPLDVTRSHTLVRDILL